MKSFILHWIGGSTEKVQRTDIADACRRAGIGNGALRAMDYYEEVKRVQVAGQSHCSCANHAETGTSCPHDLARVGIG